MMVKMERRVARMRVKYGGGKGTKREKLESKLSKISKHSTVSKELNLITPCTYEVGQCYPQYSDERQSKDKIEI